MVPEAVGLSESLWDAADFSDVRIEVAGKSFALNRFPLASKCAYFKNFFSCRWSNVNKSIELKDFPGGSAVFEAVARYCYGLEVFDPGAVGASDILIPELICAADYLQMEGDGNFLDTIQRRLEVIGRAPYSEELLVACSGLLVRMVVHYGIRPADVLTQHVARLMMAKLPPPPAAVKQLLELSPFDFVLLLDAMEEVASSANEGDTGAILGPALAELALTFHNAQDMAQYSWAEQTEVLSFVRPQADIVSADAIKGLMRGLRLSSCDGRVALEDSAEDFGETETRAAIKPSADSDKAHDATPTSLPASKKEDQVLRLTYQLIAKHLRKLSVAEVCDAHLPSAAIRGILDQALALGVWTPDRADGLHRGPGVSQGAAAALVIDRRFLGVFMAGVFRARLAASDFVPVDDVLALNREVRRLCAQDETYHRIMLDLALDFARRRKNGPTAAKEVEGVFRAVNLRVVGRKHLRSLMSQSTADNPGLGILYDRLLAVRERQDAVIEALEEDVQAKERQLAQEKALASACIHTYKRLYESHYKWIMELAVSTAPATYRADSPWAVRSGFRWKLQCQARNEASSPSPGSVRRLSDHRRFSVTIWADDPGMTTGWSVAADVLLEVTYGSGVQEVHLVPPQTFRCTFNSSEPRRGIANLFDDRHVARVAPARPSGTIESPLAAGRRAASRSPRPAGSPSLLPAEVNVRASLIVLEANGMPTPKCDHRHLTRGDMAYARQLSDAAA